MTRDEAWQKAIEQALAHYRKVSRKDTASTPQMMQALYAGLVAMRGLIVSHQMRTNDLVQLIACALDCLASGTWDAIQRGEEPKTPSEAGRSS